MNSSKYTLEDIRARKAEIVREIDKVRAEINDDVYNLTHPFNKFNTKYSFPPINKIIVVANKIHLAYKFMSTIVSFFRKKKR